MEREFKQFWRDFLEYLRSVARYGKHQISEKMKEADEAQKQLKKNQQQVERAQLKRFREHTDGVKLRMLFAEALKSASVRFASVTQNSLHLEYMFSHWLIRVPLESAGQQGKERLKRAVCNSLDNVNANYEQMFWERINADRSSIQEREFAMQRGLVPENSCENFYLSYQQFFTKNVHGLIVVNMLSFEVNDGFLEILFVTDYSQVCRYHFSNFNALIYNC